MISNSIPEVRVAGLEMRQHYRYPVGMFDIQASVGTDLEGFFQFGPATCFGCCDDGVAESISAGAPPTARSARYDKSHQIFLPFDPDEVSQNLRRERYTRQSNHPDGEVVHSQWVRRAYYAIRRFLPVHVRKHLQRIHLANWDRIRFPLWPVDLSVELMFEELMRLALCARGGAPIPFVWFWPEGHSGAMMLTHDVEEASGRDFCPLLMDLVESAGFRSSFQIIPEGRYTVTPDFLESLRKRGHEINVHDLNHDGHLFRDRSEFLNRAARIRHHLGDFGAQGFRSAILYRNPEWFDELGCTYDMSMPNVAHLDPQRGGCCTSFPYFIGDVLELPLTTTQDYSLFHILQKYSLELWEQQMEMILQQNGLVSFNIHPDYILETRARSVFVALLSMMEGYREKRNLWAALPAEVNLWWRQRAAMEIVDGDGTTKIVGPGSERATLAYAALDGGRVVYRLTCR